MSVFVYTAFVMHSFLYDDVIMHPGFLSVRLSVSQSDCAEWKDKVSTLM